MNTDTKQDNYADIVLIYPKTGLDIGSTVAPPHSLLCIAAPLREKGYKIKIIDQRKDFNWVKTLRAALESKPVCVGVSAMTGSQIYFAIEAAKVAREATGGKVPIVWGGPHPSILPEQTVKSEYADIVCVGEGDITFPELVEALQKKSSLANIQGIAFKDGSSVVLTPPRPLLDVESLLPVPWDLVDVEGYVHPDFYLKTSRRALDVGQTSRGCPFLCGFCSSASIRQRKWRAMSVEKSLRLISEPVKRFHLDGIWIRDDEFYINRERSQKICEGIIKNKLNISWYTSGTRVDVFNGAKEEQVALLKKSGAYVLKFGAESGSNRILKLINKGIKAEDTIAANLKAKRHGIIPAFALMIGFPTESFDEINQTIELAKRLITDNPQAHLETMATYTALPGTPLFDTAVKMGLRPPENLEGWANWNFDEYDFEGRKIPWYNYKDRIKIGNLAYISMLSNAVLNAIDGISSPGLKRALKIVFRPVVKYYRFRLWHKSYTFAPELMWARHLRRKLFYKSYFVIK